MPGTTFLIGGGWDTQLTTQHYGAFLRAAGQEPLIAVVVLDEGQGHGAREAVRFGAALTSTAPCTVRPVLVPEGGVLDLVDLDGADALLVCGGLTPAYATGLTPVAAGLREWLQDRPYAGFSAGAVVAAHRALVGGWLLGGRAVCPQDAAEDLDEVSVVPGLGLVPYVVDVHCAQWGTLPRLLLASERGDSDRVVGIGLDEGTMLTVTRTTTSVSGSGHAWVVRADGKVDAMGAGEVWASDVL